MAISLSLLALLLLLFIRGSGHGGLWVWRFVGERGIEMILDL
jgi:hypothetical protein